ncbi:MAG: hypothetical protein FRX49_12694 [Trebouxia sp. A1-2]|nr:MAG: hypothetical protein FRX49_12694 [Trebouxia sp. A1-2]
MERLHQRDRGEGEGQKKKRKREEGEEGEEEVHALFQPQPYILPWSSAATAWRHPPDSSTTFTPCRASTLLGTARSLHPTSLPAHAVSFKSEGVTADHAGQQTSHLSLPTYQPQL